jgi:hypothetical protein
VSYTAPATGETFRVYMEHNYYTSELGTFDLVDSTTTAPPNELYSVFLQDTWRVTPRLTVNLGVRWDQQRVFNADEVETVNLDDQWQPRVGLVYDWKGDGSTKAFASYGRFYYAIPQDLTVRIYGSQFSTTTWNYSFTDITQGGPGTGPPNRDATFQGGAAFQPVDEGIEGPYQDEFTVGVETALTPTFAVGLKGMYRTLGNTIEDRCDLDYNDDAINQGASCAMINPGSGERWAGGNANESFPWCDNAGSDFVTPTAGQCFPDGAPAVPDATRIFRGIELTARKAFTQNLWAQFSYLYSSLRGNYDGAVRTASGQTDPGINADYDYPAFLNNAHGRLYLDRPHQARLDAVYTAPFGLSVGIGAYYRSGAPVSRYGWFNDFYPNLIHYVQRGEDSAVSGGRLSGLYEANLSLAYTFNMGRVSITPGIYVLNLLDRQGVTDVREDFNLDGTFCTLPGDVDCTPDSIAAANAADPDLNHPGYSQRNFERLGPIPHGGGIPQSSWAEPTLRQEPRQIRASLKISF